MSGLLTEEKSNWLKEQLRLKSKTQKELALHLNMAPVTMWKMLNGIRKARPEDLTGISNFLNIPYKTVTEKLISSNINVYDEYQDMNKNVFSEIYTLLEDLNQNLVKQGGKPLEGENASDWLYEKYQKRIEDIRKSSE